MPVRNLPVDCNATYLGNMLFYSDSNKFRMWLLSRGKFYGTKKLKIK